MPDLRVAQNNYLPEPVAFFFLFFFLSHKYDASVVKPASLRENQVSHPGDDLSLLSADFIGSVYKWFHIYRKLLIRLTTLRIPTLRKAHFGDLKMLWGFFFLSKRYTLTRAHQALSNRDNALKYMTSSSVAPRSDTEAFNVALEIGRLN